MHADAVNGEGTSLVEALLARVDALEANLQATDEAADRASWALRTLIRGARSAASESIASKGSLE